MDIFRESVEFIGVNVQRFVGGGSGRYYGVCYRILRYSYYRRKVCEDIRMTQVLCLWVVFREIELFKVGGGFLGGVILGSGLGEEFCFFLIQLAKQLILEKTLGFIGLLYGALKLDSFIRNQVLLRKQIRGFLEFF